MELICHPATPSVAISGVQVSCRRDGGRLVLGYRVAGDPAALLLTPSGPGRTDELWRHTCFEAFVMDGQGSYREFNFAPSGAWAAYAFDAYRAGMHNAEAEPSVRWDGAELSAAVDLLSTGNWRLNLTTVIEETDGTKSYWALAHPHGPPDFHDPACFVLELPAVG